MHIEVNSLKINISNELVHTSPMDKHYEKEINGEINIVISGKYSNGKSFYVIDKKNISTISKNLREELVEAIKKIENDFRGREKLKEEP